MSELPLEIAPRDVREILQNENLPLEKRPRLIDVREAEEHAICHIAGAELIPMRTIPQHLQSLDGDTPLIVFCHHGVRSLNVVDWLRRQGVENCQSMAGGIDRWSLEIDSSVPRY